jgi:hypothetical protein
MTERNREKAQSSRGESTHRTVGRGSDYLCSQFGEVRPYLVGSKGGFEAVVIKQFVNEWHSLVTNSIPD